MTKQEVMTALECCISHDGHSECSKCPYNYAISEDNPFGCSRLLYLDVVELLGGDGVTALELSNTASDKHASVITKKIY